MADEGMDPCECIFSHELAMRRLLSFIRRSQAYCTTSECLEDLPGAQPSQAEEMSFLMMVLFVVLALVVFMFRIRLPSRRNNNLDQKPSTSQGPPPPPAAPIN